MMFITDVFGTMSVYIIGIVIIYLLILFGTLFISLQFLKTITT